MRLNRSVLLLSAVMLVAVGLCGLAMLDAGAIAAFIQQRQRNLHDSLATDLHAFHDNGDWLSALGLTGIGFLYGVFHAVGPGHGKLVVSSYMLADNSSLRRGIVIVLLSSLLQGLVAVVLVLAGFYLLGLARETAEQAAALLETVSFGLLALVGFGLLRRGLSEARQLPRTGHQHSHSHERQHTHTDNCHGCGHTHLPTPQEIDHTRGAWPIALMIVSVGIRPCSGALILLVFACLIGAVLPGIIAVFAMALGTALTTGSLAVAAAHSKALILNRLKATDRALTITHAALGIGGGLLLMLASGFFVVAGIQQERNRQPDSQPGMPLMHLPARPIVKQPENL